jgi:Family of unknown function (DUF6600)
MKQILSLVIAALVALLATPRTQAEVEISFQDFYDALSPHGDWLFVDGYGYCWQPFVDEEWRPYTDGSWIYTDAGWTWASEEEWGWATYHYGRWMNLEGRGWLWFPGYEWAPAWVSWRSGGDYVGWAPLPPQAEWTPGGFGPSVDVSFRIAPAYYSFCPVRYLGAPRLRPHIVPWRDNVTIINNTANITKITNVNNVLIFNEGPNFAEVNRRAEQRIRYAKLERRDQVDQASLRSGRVKNSIEGDVFRVTAPQVRRSDRDEKPPKLAGTIRKDQLPEDVRNARKAELRERWRKSSQDQQPSEVPPAPAAPQVGREQEFRPPGDSSPQDDRSARRLRRQQRQAEEQQTQQQPGSEDLATPQEKRQESQAQRESNRLREKRQRADEELKRSQSQQQGVPPQEDRQERRQLRRQDSDVQQEQGSAQQRQQQRDNREISSKSSKAPINKRRQRNRAGSGKNGNS